MRKFSLIKLLIVSLFFLLFFSSGIFITPAVKQRKFVLNNQSFSSELIASKLIAADSCEVRGSWINPVAFYGQDLENPRQRGDPRIITRIGLLLDLLEIAHLNTLFVASPGTTNENGFNYGWANQYAFEDFISLAKQRGFALHLWLANKFRDGSGQVDFRNWDEQKAQVDWVIDLLDRYGTYLDGVHFDYLRYTDWMAVNLEGRMTGINQTLAKVKTGLQANHPQKFLTAAVFDLEPAYANFQNEDIPGWFLTWFNDHPGNWYDTAYPDFDTVPLHMKYQQDPIGWLNQSYLEGVLPMQYTSDDRLWNQETDHWRIFSGANSSKVFMGLGWLEEADHSDWGYDPAGIVRKIKFGRGKNIGGFVIFEFVAWNRESGDFIDDQPLVEALTVDSAINDYRAPFKEKVASCLQGGLIPPTTCPTDINHDGTTDFLDLQEVIKSFTQSCDDCPQDQNRDHRVNMLDLGQIIKFWGQSCS